MSEIQNNQGAYPVENNPYDHEEHQKPAEGIAFRGEKTDLAYDPAAAIKRNWINKRVKANIGGQAVSFGTKEINQVKNDLEVMHTNPQAVKRATSLAPAFKGHAEAKGYSNPDKLALALEHYAVSNEFINNTELDLDEE